jgi:CPA2 family monovalent cation:H+ antiporter-2
VVGYGPAGREVDRLLREAGLRTRVVDLNIDTIRQIRREGREAVYGDATQAAILEDAGLARASHLVLTMPDAARRIEVIAAAATLNPGIKVLARARYAGDLPGLRRFPGVRAAVDEIEAAAELARLVLVDLGADADRIEQEVGRVRGAFSPGGQAPETARG